MRGDIIPKDEAQFGAIGSRRYGVAANASGQGTMALGTYMPAFRSGEPVRGSIEAPFLNVYPLYTTSASGNTAPLVGTDYIVGIAAGTSTETDTAAGTVEVIPLFSKQVWLIEPQDLTAFDTQAEYTALVGGRILISLYSGYAAGKYYCTATDGSAYGLKIQPLDIAKYPSKVAFCFRGSVSDLDY